MIEIAMAVALGVAPVPEPIWREDPILEGPYESIEQPCTALAAGYPGMVDQFCTDDVEVFVSGGGAQVELGFFRARLTEGEFFEGGYITRQSWQFLDQDPDLAWRTARGAYSLACVEQNTGLIERNGPPQFVVVPAGQQSGSSTITLKTSGQCRLGFEREVLSMWAFSDSELPWQNAGDFDRTNDGWDDGLRTVTVGQITFTGTAPIMPDYMESGPVYYEVSMDATTRALLAGADTPIECRDIIRDRAGGNKGFVLGGVADSYAADISNPNYWCTESRPGIVSGAATEVLPSKWNDSSVQTNGAFFFMIDYPPNRETRSFRAVGTPDRFEVTGQIAVSATLTKVEGVRDLVWEPEARPYTLGTVDGLCVDDLADCFTECRDLFDPSLNPFDNFGMGFDVFQCIMMPTTDAGEFVSAWWEDTTGTVAYQTVEYLVYSFQDVLQAPAYYARECGALVETDLEAVGQSGANQTFNTCDLDQQTRSLIFTLSGLLIAASFVFMTIRLFFYALKQRNMLIGAQMMEDDYAAADEAKNG